MSESRTWRTLALVLYFLVRPELGGAGSFDVSPIRLALGAGNPSAALTLRNSSNQAVLVQVELMKWSPPEVYDRSQDLLVNPRIFTVPPASSQVVRIGRSGLQNPEQEQAYRLFLQEVPPRLPRQSTGLRTALRLGVPIFLPPAHPRVDVQWRVWRAPRGGFKIEAVNRGNVHVQLIDVRLLLPVPDAPSVALSRSVREYLLPGQKSHWVIDSKTQWRGQTLLLMARTDGDALNAKLQVQEP